MAAKGYPNSYDKGKPISGFKDVNELPGVIVFHGGTKQHDGEVLTSGGRVLGVTAIGENITTAICRAYEAVEKIQWDGIHYRKDIGHRVRI
jgi:phosphoribosylamine---glycine ligase